MFQNHWDSTAPYTPSQGTRQQHVEYLPLHPKPEETRYKTVHLLVDSRDRDTSFDRQKGNVADFVVRFERINEVVFVEPRIVSCPKPVGETHVIMDIKQFDNHLQSSSPVADQSTAAIFFDQPGCHSETKPVRADLMSCKRIDFDPPASLDRLDIRFRTHQGVVLPSCPITLLLDITCKQLPNLYGL